MLDFILEITIHSDKERIVKRLGVNWPCIPCVGEVMVVNGYRIEVFEVCHDIDNDFVVVDLKPVVVPPKDLQEFLNEL